MKASVEAAIRSSIRPGEVLPTPTGAATFVVDKMDAEGLSLLFGPKLTRNIVDLALSGRGPGVPAQPGVGARGS